MQRERERREDEYSQECARMKRECEEREAEHNKEVARQQKEREEREAQHSADMANEKERIVIHYERTMMPRLFKAANRRTDGLLERMAKNASDLATIMGDLHDQRDEYEVIAEGLEAGIIRPSASFLANIEQQQAILDDMNESSSIVALPRRQSPPDCQDDDDHHHHHHEMH